MIYMEVADVVKMHDLLVENYGGLTGIRDRNLLLSSIESPKMSFMGKDLYSTIEEKAAAYWFFIINNHSFNDGNKRTGTATCLSFLKHNGYVLNITEKEILEYAVKIASSKTTIQEISEFIKKEN